MSKNANIIIAVLVILVGVGGLFAVYNSNKHNQAKEAVKTEVKQEALTEPTGPKVEGAEIQNTAPQEAVISEDNTNKETMQTVKGTLNYKISSGSVSYTAQKRFLQKEDAVVVGTTSEVTGTGSFDTSTSDVKLKAGLDYKTIHTDTPKRDSDVLVLFKDTSVTIEADSPVKGVSLGNAFTTEVPVKLTINGVTKEVPFSVSGKLTDSKLQADGQAQVKMSDFGIKTPSVAGIFTVDNEIMISFNINATKL